MPSRRGHAGRFSQWLDYKSVFYIFNLSFCNPIFSAPVYQSITSQKTSYSNDAKLTLEKLASKTAKIDRKYQSYNISESIQKPKEPRKPEKAKKKQKTSKEDNILAKLERQKDDLENAYELAKRISAKSSKKTKKKPKTPKDNLFRFARNKLSAVRPLPPSEAMMLKLELVQLRTAINKNILDCLFWQLFSLLKNSSRLLSFPSVLILLICHLITSLK